MNNAPVECIVCFKTVGVFSVGECDHPVCFECSTRMRVLCLQDECPICRHHLDKVIFTPECQPYKTLNAQLNNNLFERTYKISFVNETIKAAFLKLLEHSCKKCPKSPTFQAFEMLKDHLRFKHELFFCDLCVTNLRIFTAERKFYTRPQLALHRRKGDPDDLSHKGHPICQFCETHYMDNDELYRHLRKDHLFCHLCDVDGYDHYYGSYNCLRDHFRQDHYLCEEGECGEINLTAVFRSDIDLIAHKASAHGKGLSKQASRQARTLELQFTLTPRPRGPPPPPTQFRPERGDEDQNHEPDREHNLHTSPTMAIDTESTEQFPTLGDGPSGPVLTVTRKPTMVIRQTSRALDRTEENFPALGGKASGSMTPTLRVNITHQPNITAGPSNAIIKTTAKPNVSIQLHNPPTSASQFKISETTMKHQKPITSRLVSEPKSSSDSNRKFEDEFPSLNKKDKNILMNSYASPSPSGPSLAKKLASAPPVRIVAPATPIAAAVTQPKAPPPPSSNAFPALCPTGPPISQPQWIVAPKKEKPKLSKVAPAPVIPSVSDINSAQDFPSLALNSKNKNKKGNKCDINRQLDEDFKIEIGKKEKKKLKAMEDMRAQNTAENRKSVPPDSTYEKKLKESFSTLSLDSNKKKNEAESVWVEWKGKKNQLNGKTEEKVSIIEKPKEKNNSNASAKKVVDPPVLDDFPVLNAGKGLSGFGISKGGVLGLTKTNKATVNENTKNKLSYSENLKLKSANSDKFNNNNNENEDEKCKSSNIIGSPSSVFHGSVPPCNGFTFTNSSGESYNIPVHNYLQPVDFNQRNKALVVNFMKALCSQESIQEFKEVSRQFREGIYSAELYYQHCRDSINEEFETLFPELLALLPDISKQQELYKIYSEVTKCSLEVCPICGQILVPSDVTSHKDSHSLLTHFPALGSPVQSTPVWRK